MPIFTYSCGSGDEWRSAGYGLVSGGTFLYLAGTNNINDDVVTWIPFVIPDISKNVHILSATLKWISVIDRADEVLAKIGCEAADNPSTPSSEGDITGRVMTSAFTSVSFEAYTTGVEYSYDVTSAVQEVLNRSGWVAGNTLAILVKDNGTSLDARRAVASFENVTYTEPRLVIDASGFIPEIMEMT